jgi:dTDP-4-amino-4,6-dideoxygalactose transaminase
MVFNWDLKNSKYAKVINYTNMTIQNNQISKNALKRISESVQSSDFILGEPLLKFENEFAEFLSSKYVVGVSNGTDAIEIALRSLNLPSNSEVIVPSNSFIASALGVLKANLQLVLVDVDPGNLLIGLKEIQEKVTTRTKVIMPVHLFGQCAPMKIISEFAIKNDIHIVEDLAQAQGSEHIGVKAGNWGVINATSFYPGKNLGAWGDAGAVITNNEDLYLSSRKIRNYGSEVKYHHESFGSNYRMDTIQAIVLSEKLKHLKAWNLERQKLAKLYDELLVNCDQIKIPSNIEGSTHVYHIYTILAKKRNELQKYLKVNKIETLIHYPIPIHKQKYIQGLFPKITLPNSEIAATELLSLPLYPGMAEKDVYRVVEFIYKFYS